MHKKKYKAIKRAKKQEFKPLKMQLTNTPHPVTGVDTFIIDFGGTSSQELDALSDSETWSYDDHKCEPQLENIDIRRASGIPIPGSDDKKPVASINWDLINKEYRDKYIDAPVWNLKLYYTSHVLPKIRNFDKSKLHSDDTSGVMSYIWELYSYYNPFWSSEQQKKSKELLRSF